MEAAPSISNSEFQLRLQKTIELLRDSKLDALVIHSNEADFANVRYLPDYWPLFESAGVVIFPNGNHALLIGPESETFARHRTKISSVRKMVEYREPAEPDYPGIAVDTFPKLFSEMGTPSPKRIGLVGWAGFPLPVYQSLQKAFPEAEHVVLTGSGDEDACGNRSPQVDLSAYLDPGLGLSEVCPRKEREREIHCRRVQGINRVVDIQPQVFARVERSGFAHKRLGQILPELPVALFVGVGQSRFGNRLPEAQMVAGSRSRIQAVGNVAQTLAPSQLGKCHADELLPAAKVTDARLRIVAIHKTRKRLPMHEVEDLREDVAARVHGRKGWQRLRRNSNPSHHLFCATRSFYEFSKTSSVS